MLQELKERRKLSYLMNDFDDYGFNYNRQCFSATKLIYQIVQFFKQGSTLEYPAKSYFVAIIYAKCLERYFNQDFFQCLDDPELLPDDKYFIPYSYSFNIYDKVLKQIGDIWQYPSISKTVDYFKQEFLVK